MKFIWIYLAGIPVAVIFAIILFNVVLDDKLKKKEYWELLLFSLLSWLSAVVFFLMTVGGFLMIKRDERRAKDFKGESRRKYKTSQYRWRLSQAKRNIKDFPAKWEEYLKSKDLEEEDIEFAKNDVEYTVQLAQEALDFFDKMDISNNKNVSDTDKEELLAEAAELRQQVNQLRAKLKKT